MTFQTFLNGIIAAGWDATSDAQHENIERFWRKCFPESASISDLEKENDHYSRLLLDIGGFAHDRSTGPANPDDLWEIRKMAYQE